MSPPFWKTRRASASRPRWSPSPRAANGWWIAKDLGTGKKQKIAITASSGLSKEEIDQMQREAEQHAEEAKRKREEIEARNEADSAVYRAASEQARAGQAGAGQPGQGEQAKPGGPGRQEEEVVDAEVVDEEQKRAA